MDKVNVLISMFPEGERLKQLEIFNAGLNRIFSEWLSESHYETKLEKGLYAARLTSLGGNQYEKAFEISGDDETSVLLGENQINERPDQYINEAFRDNTHSKDHLSERGVYLKDFDVLRYENYINKESGDFKVYSGNIYEVFGNRLSSRNTNLNINTRGKENPRIIYIHKHNIFRINLPVSESIYCRVRKNKGPEGYVQELTFDFELKNKEAGAILRLMMSGDIERAKTLANHIRFAEKLLYSKIENPSYAALGGYFLLRSNSMEQLHDWPRNLANWFEWFPDGCIIYAVQLMRAEKTVVEDIEYWLIEAYQRGIPLFTEGLRLLYEGFTKLYFMEYGKSAIIEKAFKEIQEWISYADTESGFTVLRIPSERADLFELLTK